MVLLGCGSACQGTTYYASTSGNDTNAGTLSSPFRTIQHGLNVATHPGDTVLVRGGTYNEAISFPASGTAAGGYITLQNYSGESPSINGNGLSALKLVDINNRSYVQLIGFDIQNLFALPHDGGGVFVEGSGTNINILNNTIHHFNYASSGTDSGRNGRGIAVWGTSASADLEHVQISGNTVYDCHELYGNVVEISGNTMYFQVTGNTVHDNDGIQIDVTGGYQPPSFAFWSIRADNGTVSGNTVYNGNVNGIGIYVDGAADTVVESNVVHDTTVGIQVVAEIANFTAINITVQDNLIYNNSTYGLGAGTATTPGFGSGSITSCSFLNNTVYNNGAGAYGNIALGNSTYSAIANNIFYAGDNIALSNFGLKSSSGIWMDNNLYYTPSGSASTALFYFPKGTKVVKYTGFSAYRVGSGMDPDSIFSQPLFANLAAYDFHEQTGSPTIDAGSSSAGYFDPKDFTGATRGTPPDIGAYEKE
jgi:hypothetical protein